MSETIKDYERICKIASQKILVAEDSSVYSIFFQRRILCKNFNQIANENQELFLKELDRYDDLIKQHFNL